MYLFFFLLSNQFKCLKCFSFLYDIAKKLGSTISKSGKAIRKPPITAIANGWCSSDPVPKPIASGNNAIIAPKAVINFGRNLVDIEYTNE